MKVIDKLGRKLSKDFDKQFDMLSKEQLDVLHNTKMYRMFANKPKIWSNNKYNTNYKPRRSSTTDLDNIKCLEIISQIANDKIKDDVSQQLLDSKEPSNIIIAANILNNKYK